MFRNILVPLDGTPLSESALPYAEQLAKRVDAKLTLVRAVPAPLAPLSDAAQTVQSALSAAEDYLARHSARLTTEGVPTDTGVPFGGSPATWITEEVILRHADMVIMATHHRTGPNRWLHGSVAEAVVSRATTPVMVVHDAASDVMAARFAQPEPLLVVALDGSERAEAALPVARRFARLLSARVLLVSVIPKPGQLVAAEGGVFAFDEAGTRGLHDDAADYLAGLVDRIGMPGAAVEYVVRDGAPSQELGAVARERAAAAVIMTTHGRTGLLRSILGSVAGGTLEQCDAPLVLVRSQQVRTAEQPATEAVGLATSYPAG